ncbi:unnamed protein product [Urochloa humidicola]
MAEMVGSAVAEETLKQVVSGLIGNKRQREEEETAAGESETTEQDVERLEMAQIKLEVALEASRRWHIRDASLLRWRRKLKRAAHECGDTLRTVAEDEAREQEAMRQRRSSSFPRRLAHAAKNSIFDAAALFGRGCGDSGHAAAAAVRRFEWLADGAGEFVRFVELGGTPRGYAFAGTLSVIAVCNRSNLESLTRQLRRDTWHL